MTLFRSFLARSALLVMIILFVFQAGCGLFKSYGRTITVKLAPRVKMQLIYIEPLKIYVGRYEVNNSEYRCFQPQHSSGTHKGLNLNESKQPVVNVSWDDARAFCDWLTQNYGADLGNLVFRLPTEKEWECYANCGTEREFPWGNWPPPKNLNYYGRENKGVSQVLETYDGFSVSCPVNKSGINEWGLYGVGGNVWEWCADKEDPKSSMYVFKGASWADCAPLFLRTSRRSAYEPSYKYVNLGFRVVASPASAPKTDDQPAAPPAEENKTAVEQ